MTQTMTTAVVQQPQMTAQQQAIVTFNNKVNGSYVQNQLKSVLGANSGTFATSLVEVFTNDKKLQGCDVNKVVQEAIKAATLKLPLNKQLGYAYLMVFNNWDKEARKSVPTPTLTIGYRATFRWQCALDNTATLMPMWYMRVNFAERTSYREALTSREKRQVTE